MKEGEVLFLHPPHCACREAPAEPALPSRPRGRPPRVRYCQECERKGREQTVATVDQRTVWGPWADLCPGCSTDVGMGRARPLAGPK